MLKRIAFMMMCLSLVGLAVTAVAVAQRLGPVLQFFLP